MGPIVTIYFSQCCCGIIKGNHLPSNADAGCSSGRWWMMWTSPTTDVRQLSDKICNKPIMRTLNGHDHLFPSDQWAEVQAVPHLFYLPSPLSPTTFSAFLHLHLVLVLILRLARKVFVQLVWLVEKVMPH